MGSTVHDYNYSVQVKSRFDLFAKDDFNVEDVSLLASKNRPEKQGKRATGRGMPACLHSECRLAKSETVEKDRKKEVAPQKERREAAPKSEPKASSQEISKKEQPQRPKGNASQGRMDRHSGSNKTGVKAVLKKDGYGTGNYGTIEDELEAQTAEVEVDQPEEEKAPSEKSGPKEPVEEQPKPLTLKEYREKSEKKAKVTLAAKGTRKPNDGKNVFSDMVQVHESKPVETKVEVVLEDPKIAESSGPNFFNFGRGGGGGGNGGSSFARGGNRGGDVTGRGGRGRGGRSRNEQHVEPEGREPANPEISDHDAPADENAEGDAQATSVGRGRGGRGVDRPFRGRGRGRGGPRGGFSNDRGGSRVSFSNDRGGSRGGFSNDRGGPRGGFSNDRGVSRGGFVNERGGPRGGFSSDRGSRFRGGPGGDRPFRGGDRPPRGERGGNRGTRGAPRGGGGFTGEHRGRGGGNLEGGPTRGFRRGGRGGRGGFDHPEEGTSRDFHENPPVMDSDADFPALK